MHVPIESFRLANGLLVTLSEDHSAPVVTVNLWYHVGSANERPGRTGFAHLFEHMLFQGSAHVAANEHFEIIQRAGGTLNGSTWLDRTNYFETVPAHHLGVVLWLEADRMGQLLPAMTQQKLDTQRDVVKNERRWSVDNQPYGTWWERLPALAFPEDHPFHHSLIGSFDDLDAANLGDITAFFSRFYAPDNAVLTIAGDFERQEARRLVEEHFGPIPASGRVPPLPSMEVDEKFGDWRRETVEDDVALPRLFLAFRSPRLGTEGYYVACICAAILGLRRGSRLQRTLVREQRIASDCTAFTLGLAKGADVLVLDVTGRPGTTADSLERAVGAEVDRLRADGVAGAEVVRAAALLETSTVTALQTAADRADKISQFACYFGDARLVNAEIDRIRAVTPEAVNKFARRFLGEDNRRSLTYVARPGSAVT